MGGRSRRARGERRHLLSCYLVFDWVRMGIEGIGVEDLT